MAAGLQQFALGFVDLPSFVAFDQLQVMFAGRHHGALQPVAGRNHHVGGVASPGRVAGEPLDHMIRGRRPGAVPHRDAVDDLRRIDVPRACMRVEHHGDLRVRLRRVLAEHLHQQTARVLESPIT